ncbi:hypothetical protein HaLaN_22908 [Haematococcus lacustris]|uniref:Uncharacterized protein n=1 Tax=Haematococcus lacustris TaxID=44745 RepID=A0A6A0A1H9_HAELA|nr:hypothetical protein HaLaN_22908 [Haematococcus lacustris]
MCKTYPQGCKILAEYRGLSVGWVITARMRLGLVLYRSRAPLSLEISRAPACCIRLNCTIEVVHNLVHTGQDSQVASSLGSHCFVADAQALAATPTTSAWAKEDRSRVIFNADAGVDYLVVVEGYYTTLYLHARLICVEQAIAPYGCLLAVWGAGHQCDVNPGASSTPLVVVEGYYISSMSVQHLSTI